MEVVTRQAALCLIRRSNTFLVAEIVDPQTGAILHRPPGGGLEGDENPEAAVRRELREELGIVLRGVEPLGSVDHIWFWNGREIRERAWLFVAYASDDPRLDRGECPELVEPNGERFRTLWRPIQDDASGLPPLCPPMLLDFLL